MSSCQKLVLNVKGDDEEGMNLQPQALYFAVADSDEDIDEDEPPMDGMEYLRRVVKERRTVPQTVVANIDEKELTKHHNDIAKNLERYLGIKDGKAPVPEEYCPSVRWQNEQVAEFSQIRLKLARHTELIRAKAELNELPKLPDKDNELLWCLFCHGSSVWKEIKAARAADSISDEEEEDEDDISEESEKKAEKKLNPKYDEVVENFPSGTSPTVSVMVSLPVHVVEKVLEYQMNWMKLIGWRKTFGVWLYSLLVKLEKPLKPEVGSWLRDIVLFCAKDRYDIYQTKAVNSTESSGENENVDEMVATYNLFICLVAKYFNQLDLADY